MNDKELADAIDEPELRSKLDTYRQCLSAIVQMMDVPRDVRQHVVTVLERVSGKQEPPE